SQEFIFKLTTIFSTLQNILRRPCVSSKTQGRLTQNASAFKIKRKCVSVKTQVHFTSNARVFFQGRKITREQAV
ncbi:hypothetical protein, partial [Phocaeicola plebeius]|uniref:hypothetical protein n=1 Tax=Phocaeicola plebeius TaxID=310297 RepID=UPI0026EA93B3